MSNEIKNEQGGRIAKGPTKLQTEDGPSMSASASLHFLTNELHYYPSSFISLTDTSLPKHKADGYSGLVETRSGHNLRTTRRLPVKLELHAFGLFRSLDSDIRRATRLISFASTTSIWPRRELLLEIRDDKRAARV